MSLRKKHYARIIDVHDEIFYHQIRENPKEHRKIHCAVMDILNRDFLEVDNVTLLALKTLQIVPDCKNEEELNQVVAEIKNNMLDFCKSHGIVIDAMNTMSASEIIDIRNCGRNTLRELYCKDE